MQILRDAARLVLAQARVAVLAGMQYRADFIIQIVLSVLWTGAALVPLLVLYDGGRSVAGWPWNEALLVVGCFMLLKGVIEAVIEPSLTYAVELIRTGRFDAVLLRPADAQFAVSTAKIQPWNATDTISGTAMLVFAMVQIGRWPTPLEVLVALGLLIAGAAILFAVLGMMIGLAFVVVKVDNLIYLFLSLYEAARWPGSVYRGALYLLFTTAFPFIVMTTFPAEALRGTLKPGDVGLALVVAAVFMIVSRIAWRAGIRRYTSAGG
jgi:ABC-2 type transport system permease protein